MGHRLGHLRWGGKAANVPSRWHGTTGTGEPAASMPGPGLKRPMTPSRLRVPSGKRMLAQGS